MGIYIETLILYILLFFSGSAAFFTGQTAVFAGFSAAAEFVKIILYYIPSLALIWYLIFKAQKTEIQAIKPGKKDLVSGLIALPCLLITGSAVTLTASHISGTAVRLTFYSPSTAPEWIILCFVCIFSACLEESYFRFYLLSRREEMNLNPAPALALSVVLFSVCHIYAGFWSFLNAAISGAFLGLIFLRYKSIHGIAAAHALYNISAFVINALMN